jgi:hypothetical protein
MPMTTCLLAPRNQTSGDAHIATEVVFQFIQQTGRSLPNVGDLLGNRTDLVYAFAVFDGVRGEGANEFNLYKFDRYDGEPIYDHSDDELPAGHPVKVLIKSNGALMMSAPEPIRNSNLII